MAKNLGDHRYVESFFAFSSRPSQIRPGVRSNLSIGSWGRKSTTDALTHIKTEARKRNRQRQAGRWSEQKVIGLQAYDD